MIQGSKLPFGSVNRLSLLLVIIMQLMLIWYLMASLHVSRSNERELSRRVYQSVRAGQTPNMQIHEK